jgi:hypothetical protein
LDLNYFSVCFLVEAADGITLEKLETASTGIKTSNFSRSLDRPEAFLRRNDVPKFLYYLKHKKTYPYAIRGQWIVLEVKHVTCQKCQTEVKPTRFGI